MVGILYRITSRFWSGLGGKHICFGIIDLCIEYIHMDNSRIEDVYRILLERDYTSVNSYENTPFSPEIAVIKLMAVQYSKGKRVNILPELDKITGIDPAYEYLMYEAQFVANGFHNKDDRKKLKSIAEKAISLGSVPAFSLSYMGMVYEGERKFDEAILCFTKIIQKYPSTINARTNGSYLLASKQKKYEDAKKLIMEGGKNWISWINHKAVLIMEYKLGIPLILGLTLLLWLLNSYPLVFLLLATSLGFLIWSLRPRQRFIMDISKWSLYICIVVLILLRNPISLSGIASGFTSIGNWNKPTPTYATSPIDWINLEELMITIQDLPSSISWDTTGIRHVIDTNAGLKGENSVQALYSPISSDFTLDISVLRFSSNTLAEEYYNKPVATDVHGYLPPEWKFKSPLANQARLTCDSNFGTNINGPLMCIWIARYGQIVVNFRAELDTEAYTLETMQKTVEKIDEKITQAFGNIE